MKPTLAVIGLGKLGLPLATCLASKGFSVYGADKNEALITKLSQGENPYFETNLNEKLSSNADRLNFTASVKEAVLQASISFVVVPTPSLPNGNFSLQAMKKALQEIGEALTETTGFHTIVLASTVSPGSFEELKNTVEENSGKRCGRDFGICYNPQFIALGSVIKNILSPDMVLIGESDTDSGTILATIYDDLLDNEAPFLRTQIANAEIAKLAVNTFVTTKISFANLLARLCETLPGANVDEVTKIVGSDSRIGTRYLKGGSAFGGPCFPRDNEALIAFAESKGMSALVPQATAHTNQEEAGHLLSLIEKHQSSPQAIVGVLGLTYKTDTNVVERSAGTTLCKMLVEKQRRVFAFDPVAMGNAKREVSLGVEYVETLGEFLENVDVLVITVPWMEFRELEDCVGLKPNAVVIDCWRFLDAGKMGRRCRYVRVGVGP